MDPATHWTKLYKGRYLAAARHLVKLLTEIDKYDSGLPINQRFYNGTDIRNKAQRSVNRAEFLAEAYINSNGETDVPIPPE